MTTIGRNIRNWTMLIFGRFVLDLLIYGPTFTFQSLAEKSLSDVVAFPFTAERTRIFTARFVVEGLGVVVGWLAYAAVVEIFSEQNGQRKRRSPRRRSLEEEFPAGAGNVDKLIEDNFAEVLSSVSL